jgi:hypothetical protein
MEKGPVTPACGFADQVSRPIREAAKAAGKYLHALPIVCGAGYRIRS